METKNLEIRNLITLKSGNEDTDNKVKKVFGIPWDNDKYILVYGFKAIMKGPHKPKPTENCNIW